MIRELVIVISILLSIFSLNAQSLQISQFKSAHSCDYLVICPDNFISCGLKLANFRNSYTFDDVEKGMAVSLSTLEQEFPVDDTFPRAYSIWYALKYATEHWVVKPKYVVLLGDDSVKVNGFDTLSAPPQSAGLMPTFFYEATVNKSLRDTTKCDTMYDYNDFPYLTVADTAPPLYRSFNGYRGGYSEIKSAFSLGRIPAQSIDQCSTYIDKLIRYENGAGKESWYNRMILTADDAMQGNVPDPIVTFHHHQQATEDIAQKYFKGCFIDKTYLSSFSKSSSGCHEQAKLHFFDAVNKGGRSVVYFGHGHPDSLCDEGFLRARDTALFTNDSSLSIYFSFSCENGDFLRKNSVQMCKAFLFTSRGGSVAYVAASVQTYATENEVFAGNIFSQMDSSGSRSIGKTVLNAKLSVNGSSSRYYQVLGDPAIKFTKSRMASSITFKNEQNGVSCVTTIPPSITGQLKYHYRIVKRDSVTCLDGLSPKYIDDSLIVSFDGISSDGQIVTVVPNTAVTPKTHYILYAWNDTCELRLDTCVFFQSGIAEKNTITAPVSGFKFNRNILTVSFPVLAKRTATASITLFAINGTQIKMVEVPLERDNAELDLQKTHLPRGNYIFRAATEGIKITGKICFVR